MILVTPKKYFLRLFVLLGFLAILSRALIAWSFANKPNAVWTASAITPCCFDCFAVGAILAYLFVYNQNFLRRILRYDFVFWLCLLISYTSESLYALNGPNLFNTIFARSVFSLFCFWLIGKAGLGDFKKIFGGFLKNPGVVFMGKISYGIYIFHHFMDYFFKKLLFPGVEVLYFLATVLLASISWKFFETPINNLKKNYPLKIKS
jgi:peptidoglycan/LPS O-acetylase OafA/YrhL